MSAIAARRARLAAAAQASLSSTPEPLPISEKGKEAASGTLSNNSSDTKRLSNAIISEESSSADERRRGDKKGKRIKIAEDDARKQDNLPNSSYDSAYTHNGSGTDVRQTRNDAEVILSKVTESSKFTPILEGEGKNVHLVTKKSAICALEVGETMNLLGRGTVKVLDGSASLGGALLSSQHREALVLASTVSPLPVLEAIGTTSAPAQLKQYGFGLARNYAAVIQVEEDIPSRVGELHSICTQIPKNAFEVSSFYHPSWPLASVGPQYTQSKALLHVHVPNAWKRVLTATEELLQYGQTLPPTFLVRGPKRVGKSTLSRFLLQRLLTKHEGQVAYLETDLGQSEFSLPGMVSLHVFDSAWQKEEGSTPLLFAPSWASIRQPVNAHFLGDYSPKNDPGRYIAAIQNLLTSYRNHWASQGVPLIVNTQGWVKGLGAQLLSQIEALVEPSLILNISEEVDMNDAEEFQDAPLPRIVTLEASPSLFTRERSMNAVEARSLSIISYFYASNLPATGKDILPSWSTSKGILERPPFSIKVSTGLKGGIHILDHGACVSERLSLMALNGSCVAVVISRDDGQDDQDESTQSSPWSTALRKQFPPHDASTCIGLGIVQSIDVANGSLNLISPISEFVIRSAARALYGGDENSHSIKMSIIKGAVDIPVCLSLDRAVLNSLNSSNTDQNIPRGVANVAFADVPYLDFDVNTAEEEVVIDMKKRRIRRNLLRPSQRKG
ncbi:uncharacterized protein FA14DRAFT_25303 [Meira miltonrushii]|uniref:Polynucleotide 5'-hydroxyl-kinase GRC3 n=1 Tax=Meira miltonrushii TaxID=1280837 RepID=A0A316VL56_9BASI|nr:uncharacterized protein FA14DRAFT_25303 [Meira miltonrushii]PWN38286.1 hypothetical protein FA14DRAFT_25303 [Meira miltonrushii]